MKHGIGLLLTGLLLSPFVYGQVAPPQQSVAQMYQRFEQKLNSIDAWKHQNGSENDLDLILVRSKDPQYFRKSQDGKLYLLTYYHELSVELRTEFPRFNVPVVSFVAPNPVDSVNVAAATKLRDDVKLALERADAPCNFDEERSGDQVEISCSGNPMQFLNYLMNFQVAECPAAAASQCDELDGQRYKHRHTPKERMKPMPTPLWDLLADTFSKKIADGTWLAVDDEGRTVTDAKVKLTNSENQSPLILIPRVLYEKLDAAERARWILLSPIDAKGLLQAHTRIKLAQLGAHVSAGKAQAADRRQALDAVQALAKSPSSSTALGAIKLADTDDGKVCTIDASTDPRTVDSARVAVLMSSEFFEWSKTKARKRGFDHVEPNMDSLYAALQKHKCTIVIDTVPNVTQLTKDLTQDGGKVAVMGTAFGHEAMANVMAQTKGFANDADLKLARSFGSSSNETLKIYRAAGVVDKASFDAAIKRMNASKYGYNDRELPQFIVDETAGAKQKTSAVAIRDERYAAQARNDPYNGLSPLAASYKALAVLRKRASDMGSRSILDECASQIAGAERETDDYIKSMMARRAKDYCATNAR